jgi:hypothetical protein
VAASSFLHEAKKSGAARQAMMDGSFMDG